VLGLRVLGTRNVGFVGEEFRDIRETPDLVIEGVEAAWQRLLDRILRLQQSGLGLAVDLYEGQTVLKIFLFGHLGAHDEWMSESPWVHVDNQAFPIDVVSDRRTFRLYRQAIVAHGNNLVRRTSSFRSPSRLARTEKRRPKATIRKLCREHKKN
jgi:hypothetical protein